MPPADHRRFPARVFVFSERPCGYVRNERIHGICKRAGSLHELPGFWPEEAEVPVKISERHAVAACADPRTEYCRIFPGQRNYILSGNRRIQSGGMGPAFPQKP